MGISGFTRILAIIIASGLPLAANAALVQYSYTGQAFSSNPDALGVDNITASFIIEDLGADFTLATIIPDSWSMSDGLTTITDADTGFLDSLQVGTTAGVLDEWLLSVTEPGTLGIDDFFTMRTASALSPNDQTKYCTAGDASSCSFVSVASVDTPGMWTSSAVVPVPPAFWLFGTAIGVLAWFRKSKH